MHSFAIDELHANETRLSSIHGILHLHMYMHPWLGTNTILMKHILKKNWLAPFNDVQFAKPTYLCLPTDAYLQNKVETL